MPKKPPYKMSKPVFGHPVATPTPQTAVTTPQTVTQPAGEPQSLSLDGRSPLPPKPLKKPPSINPPPDPSAPPPKAPKRSPDPYESVTLDLVVLHVRLPLALKREVRSAARASGVTISAYVRACLVNTLPPAPTSTTTTPATAPEKRVGALGHVYQRLVVWFAGVRF